MTDSRKRLKSSNRTKSLKATLSDVDMAEILEALETPGNPARFLKSVRKELSELREGYRRRLRQAMFEVYCTAYFLYNNDDAWTDFCQLREWDGFSRRPRYAHKEDALPAAVRLMVGFGGKAKTKLISKRKNKLKPYFDQNLAPSEVRHEMFRRNKSQKKSTSYNRAPKLKSASIEFEFATDNLFEEMVNAPLKSQWLLFARISRCNGKKVIKVKKIKSH